MNLVCTDARACVLGVQLGAEWRKRCQTNRPRRFTALRTGSTQCRLVAARCARARHVAACTPLRADSHTALTRPAGYWVTLEYIQLVRTRGFVAAVCVCVCYMRGRQRSPGSAVKPRRAASDHKEKKENLRIMIILINHFSAPFFSFFILFF